jgi:hypothetical protein
MKSHPIMVKCCALSAVVFAVSLMGASLSNAQEYPILDAIADKVVKKYQQSSCEQLWQQKSQPKSAREQEAVEKLRANPGMRQEFINRVAPQIANKMFECGMIP